MSSTKNESREEVNEDSEEQDVTEAGRVFQRIKQEGRKEDRWAEVEHKGISIDLGFRRLYLQREDAEESFSWRQGDVDGFRDELPEENHRHQEVCFWSDVSTFIPRFFSKDLKRQTKTNFLVSVNEVL